MHLFVYHGQTKNTFCILFVPAMLQRCLKKSYGKMFSFRWSAMRCWLMHTQYVVEYSDIVLTVLTLGSFQVLLKRSWSLHIHLCRVCSFLKSESTRSPGLYRLGSSFAVQTPFARRVDIQDCNLLLVGAGVVTMARPANNFSKHTRPCLSTYRQSCQQEGIIGIESSP